MTNEVDFLDAATVLRFLSMMNGNISDGTPNGAPAYPLSTTSNINQGNVGDRSQEGPRIVITEQPASKSLRFRYECEGRSAGSIPGVNSTPENKTFPTIKIEGFKGNAVIVVSCVTKDEPHRAHPHNLVGKDGCKNGIYTVEIKDDSMTAVFPNLGIQCVKRKDIEEALKLREKIRVDPFRQGFAHKNQPSSIDLNAVRLCFQAFLRDGKTKKIIHVPSPVVSEPIFDKKAMSDLVITKLSHSSAPAKGGQEMILLCEKVAKEDIQVYFYEERNGNIVWEQYGEFQPGHVHKQVAISFKTPQYNGHIKAGHKAKVNIQLKRPSDGAVSEPLPFAFTPEDASGKVAFDQFLRSLNPDYDILARILADPDHPLTKELLALQRKKENGDFVSDDDSDSEEIAVPKCGRENSSSEDDSQSSDEEADVEPDITPPTYESRSSELSSRDEVDDSSAKLDAILEKLKSNPKETKEFTSKEAVDNLSTVPQAKLRELGVVFSENEEPEESLENLHFREFVENVNKLKKEKLTNSLNGSRVSLKSEENFGLYTSLQMAMKNTVMMPDPKRIPKGQENYEFMSAPPRPSSVKPELGKLLKGETRPPLPPKRVKKNPNGSLPPVPEKLIRVPLIQRIFTKKKKSKKEDNAEEFERLSRKSLSECRLSMSIGDDLTEAEHYALYTSLAPIATDSECDETSCYYSPVEAEPVK